MESEKQLFLDGVAGTQTPSEPSVVPAAHSQPTSLPDSGIETELIILTKKLERADLNPMDEALAYRRLMDAPHDMSPMQIAKAFGKDSARVSEVLQLLDWPGDLQDRLRHKQLTIAQARPLTRIRRKSDRVHLAGRVERGRWTAEDTERQVHLLLGEYREAEKDVERTQLSRLMLDPEADPLTPQWVKLASDAWLSRLGVWTVSYRGGLRWSFHVKPATGDPSAAALRLAEWFRKMADALEGHSKDSPPL